MKKQNSVVISGYYGFQNAGDELILKALLSRLARENDPPTKVTVLSQDPAGTTQRFGVPSVDRWHLWEWVAPMREARRFILGGGGLLQESSGVLNHAYYLFLVVMAKLLGCQTEVVSIGVDPVRHTFNRWWTRFVFNYFVDSISVRDADSQRELEAVGVHFRILRMPDLVFQLDPPAPLEKSNSSRIAIALAPWTKRVGWEHDVALMIDRMSEQLKATVDLLVFFPVQDEPLARSVASKTTHPVRIRVWEQPEDLHRWMPEYDLVIGMRYHSLVLAALAQRAFIGWGTEKKIRSVCQDFEQALWSFERGWQADAILRQISEAWRTRLVLPDRYRSRLTQQKSSVPLRFDIPRIYTTRA